MSSLSNTAARLYEGALVAEFESGLIRFGHTGGHVVANAKDTSEAGSPSSTRVRTRTSSCRTTLAKQHRRIGDLFGVGRSTVYRATNATPDARAHRRDHGGDSTAP